MSPRTTTVPVVMRESMNKQVSVQLLQESGKGTERTGEKEALGWDEFTSKQLGTRMRLVDGGELIAQLVERSPHLQSAARTHTKGRPDFADDSRVTAGTH